MTIKAKTRNKFTTKIKQYTAFTRGSLQSGFLRLLQTAVVKIFYSPNKHGKRINNTNIIETTQLQSRQNTLEARFKFRHTFGP